MRWRTRAGARPSTQDGSPEALIELPPRRVFHDDELEARFRADGFAIVRVFPDAVVSELLAIFRALGPPVDPGGYHHELWGHDRARKEEVRRLLLPLVGPSLQPILVDYVPQTHAYIRKLRGEDTRVHPHVDISFVDEGEWRSVMMWASLTGAAPGEGILHLVPGSHRLRGSLRAHLDQASTFPDLVDDVVDRWAVPAELAPGEAVIFDHGVTHYAEPNLSSHETVVVQSVCIPAEAGLRYSAMIEDGRARVYEVDEDFYLGFSLNEQPSPTLLAAYRPIAEVATPTDRLERTHFEQLTTHR